MAAVSEVTREGGRAQAAETAVGFDSLFLALAVGLSGALYVAGLGFYSDDWAFLELLTRSADQSLGGLYRALAAGDAVIRQRPVQIFYLAGLYRLFGLQPLAYHVANLLLMASGALLFHRVLRALGQPRLVALSVPLVYWLLPHYSTDRFWLAAHQATISMVFYFLSLYADLRARPGQAAHFLAWKLFSLAGLVVSGLAYEAALPLFLLNPLWVWLADRHRPAVGLTPAARQRRWLLSVTSHYLTLALVIAFKLVVTVRLDGSANLLAHLVGLALGALRVNFGIYGVGLPYVVWWILTNAALWPVAGLSAAVGVATYAYLARLPGRELPSRRHWLALAATGLLVFGLGYAIFVTTTSVWFTSASLGNRVSIAAAAGVALVFVGLLGWASRQVVPRAWQRQAVCLGVAALTATGFLINNTLAAYWVTAYQQQRAIVEALDAPVRALPAHSTLILDAVCLELGGAYLFTGNRDVASALRLRYGDETLWATAITNPPDLSAGGLTLLTYGAADFYAYADNLFIYDFARQALHPLPDEASARRYFDARPFAPESDCPPGFAWGLNAS